MDIKKWIIGIILVIVLVAVTIVVLNVKREFELMKGIDTQGIGKKINIVVDLNDILDYRYFEGNTTILWKETEKKKLIQYMEESKLNIIPGKYTISQTITFEESLKIFKFKKIE